MLRNYLNEQAFDYLDKRDSLIATLRTEGDWKNRQEVVKKAMLADIGSFPERTPLNARTIKIEKKDGYSIEKIVFESMPDYYVAGCLFIPDGIRGKRPAILHLTGHSGKGFSVATYQRLILNLVRKGFIVLAIDPLGQAFDVSDLLALAFCVDHLDREVGTIETADECLWFGET